MLEMPSKYSCLLSVASAAAALRTARGGGGSHDSPDGRSCFSGYAVRLERGCLGNGGSFHCRSFRNGRQAGREHAATLKLLSELVAFA